MSEPFIAEIKIFAGNFAPQGWAFCDGQLLPISQNTALFSIIGTVYGGDGETTTALPNLVGRAPMHPGQGPGLTLRRLGERLGAETVTLSPLQMPNHRHDVKAVERTQFTVGDNLNPAGNYLASPQTGTAYVGPGSQVSMGQQAIVATGGGQPHNNMQPFLVMNFIIALVGLFPPSPSEELSWRT